MGPDRGVVAANTAYSVGDVVTMPYGSSSAGYARVMIMNDVTSGPNRFISATNYKRLSPRMPGINVQDWGAQGNGITDDTAAIQAAIDFAATSANSTGSGSSVYMPGGYYITSAPIILRKHVWLFGAGMRSTTIKLAANANCHVVKSDDAGGAAGNADYTGLVNLNIDGNRLNQDGAGPYHGVVFNTTPLNATAAGDSYFDMHHLVQNVTVFRAKGDGVHCSGRSAIQMYNVHLQQNLGNGFKSTYDITLVGCEADANGSTGFNINNGSVKLVGCKAYLNGVNTPTTDGAGFSFGSTGSAEVVGCESQNNKLAGYNLVAADRIFLSGCNADSNNTQDSANDSERVGVSMIGSTNCIIDVVSNEVPQGGVQLGHQGYALHIDASSSQNDIRVTHSALPPAVIIGDLTPSSVPGNSNSICVNGAYVSPVQAAAGVATRVKAGTPTDADWPVAPPVGTLVVDTSANKLWVRTAAATWKGVVVA